LEVEYLEEEFDESMLEKLAEETMEREKNIPITLR
jgi:hypothetical protein